SVGYGRPPKQHQFKPGNPGGPGRPKGRLSLRAMLLKKLTRNNDRAARQIVDRIIRNAKKGDVKALLTIFRFTE
ncbi:MAG TPA: DUF5681 domain-containing protein, partial [Fimbriimonadaceae bacterium]|nr:DUF5681 domain-containing protein [Fimbriimonadaceae bacterium]